MTKVAAVIQLLKEKGGPASLRYIYDNIEKFYPGAKIAKDWEAGLRGIIYREVYKGQNFKRVGPSLYALIDNVVIDEDEIIEDERGQFVDKALILKEAKAFVSLKESHKTLNTPKRVRIESRTQKKRIADLENYSCQLCGWSVKWKNAEGKEVSRIDVDHIIEKQNGGGEESSNLWALCPNHHLQKTLGIIRVDLINKRVTENGKAISLHHDNHLGWI